MSTPPWFMTDHFLPDYHHWGEITSRIEDKMTVPIRRVKKVAQWTGDPPFLTFGCTWSHPNCDGVFTEEMFQDNLVSAVESFANTANEYAEFLAYPITYKPPTVEGIAYHDWCGAIYPFDIRATIMFDENVSTGEIDDETGVEFKDVGLSFAILTLISAEIENAGE